MKRKKGTNSITTKAKGSKRNILVAGFISVVFIAVAVFVFMGLSETFKTESYYVLSSDVPARQPITTDLVVERTTAKGSAPQNALSYNDIQQGNLYSRYALYQGDVISWSNSGPASDTTLGIPDGWSVTSFNVSSDDAVGGVVGRGDYIDILAVSDGNSRYVLNNVLILSVTTASVEETTGEVTRIGETMQYTVGMPAEDVATLHAAISQYNGVKVIKAPVSSSYNDRDTTGLSKTFNFGENVTNKDLIEGSDPSFSPIARDNNGRPINEANCSAGLTEPSTLCEESGFTFNTKTDSKENGKPATNASGTTNETKPTDTPSGTQ